MLQSFRTPTWRSEQYRMAGPVRLGALVPDLYLSLLGRFVSTGRFVYQQVSPCVSIHLVSAGRGEMRSAGRSYDVGPGDLFAFFPGCHYDYHDTPASPWRYDWITLDGRQVLPVLRHVGLTRETPHICGRMHAGVHDLVEEILPVYARPTVSAAYAVAAGWRLIDALSASSTGDTAVAPARSIAEAARYLIDRHTMEVLAIERLAEQLGVSRSALFRHFRSAYGQSPKQYLEAVRCARARAMLSESTHSLKHIAAACGYSSAQYLIRAFRKHYGQSPGAWRKTAH